MNEEIRIYFASLPLYSTQGNNFTIGYIDNIGNLNIIDNNDPLLSITILEPSSGKLVNNNFTIIVSPSSNNITLRLKITYDGYTQYFSFLLVPSLPGITLNNIYNRLIEFLPKNVYDNSIDSLNQADIRATAQVIYQLYNNQSIQKANYTSLVDAIDDFYPSSGSVGWEKFLTGSTRLLYQDVTQYGAILEHIYQCEINNNTNPYWAAFNISKYIYLWLGISKYVYIGESIIHNINLAFILNQNSLGNSIFIDPNGGTDSSTIVIYVCSDGDALNIEQQNQINLFIRQITRAGMAVEVVYNQSLSQLGFTQYLGNTYHKDPRQSGLYCIQYNQNILDNALGYTGTGSEIIHILDYSITITGTLGDVINLDPMSTNILLLSSSPYKITQINTTPIITDMNLNYFIQYFSDNITSLDFFWDGTNENIVLNNTVTGVNLITYLSAFNNTYNINIV